jgi:phosphoribosyl-AMP cyclohydrolase
MMPENVEWSELRWNERGLLPAVVQDVYTGEVLMVAWMNEQSLRITVETGETHFWSRSRDELWHKGAVSGNLQRLRALWVDCDNDTLLLQVEPLGPACHTGATSCFFRSLAGTV